MKLKTGFIGFGKSTNRYHLPYVLKRENIEVKKIYNRTRKEELENKYKDYDIEFTNDLNSLLEDKEIKLVTICTPHSTHFEFAKLCLEHNKNVLIEKPFATTLEEAKELLNLAKDKGLIIMPYQNRRFDGDFLALKEVINKKYVGDIVEIESHFDYYRPESPTYNGKYYDGSFFGLGVHTVDQIVSIFGRPKKVYYDIRAIRNKNNPDDYYHVELFYDSFKVILKTSHLVKSPYPKFILHGTKGSFIKYGIDKQEECLKAGIMPWDEGFGLDPEELYGKVTYVDENGQDKEITIKTPLGDYGRVYDNLYDAIINGKDKLVKDEEILTVIEILESGFKGENPKIYKFE
ncbi:oxidoreductase [Fonticella tunisiensis]|uniref:Putative dehydrogenase n=1 Tax=Fonticella tunisiensis TaxID=1096341 RepID=A0A4V3ETP5_9CLOT|nr:oxidoreductase [Fonticella tunisiensis]TDT63265.1 putative dehydrogenase [Fonticella tunisiensis]